MNFQVGQKVVCVKNGPWWGGNRDRLVLGAIYTIRRLIVADDGDLIFQIHEIQRSPKARQIWGDDVGYAAFRFRPVVERKTDISIFTKMLKPETVT
jgi:hypothetical protein